ncbi:MAG: (Fe-S)-binding protein [Actinobacteria bacterium]|nr:(Fe-S)-binding protein [Actinomycetota bacterium]
METKINSIKTQHNKKAKSTSQTRAARVFLKGDDLFACSRCGTCLSICPIYKNTLNEGFAPRGKLSLIEAVVNGKIGFTDKLSEKIYTCTMCNLCTTECPSGVKVSELFRAVREDLIENSKYPEVLDYLKDKIEKAYNITFDTNQGRLDWLKQVPDTDINDYVKPTADVVYFVGCVSSFSPRSFSIPRAIVKILKKADVDFTLLGEDEWCCGFPLLSSGMKEEVGALAMHNIEKVIEKKAKILLTSCPSCFHTWKHEYESLTGKKIPFEILHISQYLLNLVNAEKIKPGKLDVRVTYHDPCDLGRNSGVFEQPRQLLKSIPGVELVEMQTSKKQANCCGGGGNIESLNQALSAKIADSRAGEIIDTKAEIAVSACQQCERTLATALKKRKGDTDYKIKVMDVSEILLESLEG